MTKELPPDTALYLKCLTNKLQARGLIDRLALDYTQHQNEPLYENYMDQFIDAQNQIEYLQQLLEQHGIAYDC